MSRYRGVENVEGCHDITAAADSGHSGDDGRCDAVRLTSDGPVARTLLHGAGRWVVDRFDKADIVVSPQLSVSVLCRRGVQVTLRRESTS